MMDMPDRIWAGDYVGIVGLPSPIWFDEKPGNNGDLARQTKYLRSTPERERAGEMRELVKRMIFGECAGENDSCLEKAYCPYEELCKLLATITAEEGGEG